MNRRKSSCHNADGTFKRTYGSRRHAKRFARKDHAPYECEDCGQWHLTSKRNNHDRVTVFCKQCGWYKEAHRADEPWLCRCLKQSLRQGLNELRELLETRGEIPEDEESPAC